MNRPAQKQAPPARAVTPLYAVPPSLEARPWRVVLVVPPAVPRWLVQFRDLAAHHGWLDLAVLPAPGPVAAGAVPAANAGLRFALAWERLLHRGGASGLAPEAVQPDAGGTGRATLETLRTRVADMSADLVLLATGTDDLAWALSSCAPAGCWRIDADLTDPRHAGLSLLGPMLRSEAATPVELVLEGDAGTTVTLAASRGRIRAASFLMTRRDAFRKLPPLLLRALRRVATGDVPPARGTLATLRLRTCSAPPSDPAAGPRLLASTFAAIARSLARRLRYREWALLLRHEASPIDPDAPALGAHSVLKAPKGWWADPCVVKAAGRRLLFVEEMDLATQQASIACVELASEGACRLGTVLEEPGHLSFPQVFQWEGRWYMTVESGYDRRASLYRSTSFPMAWQRVADLVTGWPCVDPVLHHYEGRWYLFLNVAENHNSTSEDLFLFVADALEGPYRPHPASPIVCDVRRARMAGRIFRHGGRLIRPSQDCGPRYGSAVVFNEILELGPDVYRERQLSRLQPEGLDAIEGCHSYSVDGDVEVLDMLGYPSLAPELVPVFGDRRANALRRAGGQETRRRRAPLEARTE